MPTQPAPTVIGKSFKSFEAAVYKALSAMEKGPANYKASVSRMWVVTADPRGKIEYWVELTPVASVP